MANGLGWLAGRLFGTAQLDWVMLSKDLRGLSALAPGVDGSRIILHFHGGGFFLFSPFAYQEFIGRLSAATGARVVAVDFRKPPDVRYPEILDDVRTAWRWAQEQTRPDLIAVCGDSAGANLAMGLLVTLARGGEAQPVAYLGLSPLLSLDMEAYWYDAFGRLSARLYLGCKSSRQISCQDPVCSPVFADKALLASLPPILMHVGSWEVTTVDVQWMSKILEGHGIEHEVQYYPAPHIFQVLPGFRQSSRDSLRRIDTFLNDCWGAPAASRQKVQ